MSKLSKKENLSGENFIKCEFDSDNKYNVKDNKLQNNNLSNEDSVESDETLSLKTEENVVDEVDLLNEENLLLKTQEEDFIAKKDHEISSGILDSALETVDNIHEEDLEIHIAKSAKTQGNNFNEMSNYKLLTKEEEQGLGADINKAFEEMLKSICITNIICDHMNDLVEKLRNPYSYEQTFEEYFNVDKFENNKVDFRLLDYVFGLIDNFLNIHSQWKKKNKGSIVKNAIGNAIDANSLNIQGMDRLIEFFNRTNINKNFVLKVVNNIRDVINSACASYEVIEKNRLNKKKKDDYHQGVVEKTEEKIGISFKYALDFLKYLNSLTYMQNKARNRLALSNLRLVGFVASSFRERGVEYSTLIQFGCHGLLKGILGFDFQKGTRLCTYASFWIRQAMSRGLLKNRIISIPSHLIDCYNKFKKAKNALANSGLDPSDFSDEEIAIKGGLDPSLVQKAIKEIKQTGSLDRYIGDSDQKVMLEEVLSDNKEDPMKAYYDCEQSKIASYALLQVSEKSEASIRFRSLSNREANSVLHSYIPNISNQNMNNKQTRMAFCVGKLGPDYDPKIAARRDIGAVNTIRRCLTPIEVDMQTTKKYYPVKEHSKTLNDNTNIRQTHFAQNFLKKTNDSKVLLNIKNKQTK